MIIYSITYAVEDKVESHWISYMKEVHIPKILKSGLSTDHHFTKVLAEETTDTAYNLQIHYPSRVHLEQFLSEIDQTIQNELNAKFQGKLGSFSTFLEQV